ncbi:MAG: AAA family ATPase [Candidatus Marsarchaeota archaeon]|nr:AAA family ATPase [Candidatus Marsarchaeota archaeon]
MTEKVIGITGPSGAGKSTLSRKLAAHFDYTLVPIGEVMRESAKRKGFAGLTAYAEEKGIKALFADFRKDVLEAIGACDIGGVIADGVYEYELFEALKLKYNNDLILVGISLSDEDRVRRIGIRMADSEHSDMTALAEMRRRDKFKIDVGLEAVLKKADITIEKSEALLAPDEIVQACVERLSPLLRRR